MKAATAGAVIALATAVAGAALLAGIVAGSAIEALGQRGDQVMMPASTSPITGTAFSE